MIWQCASPSAATGAGRRDRGLCHQGRGVTIHRTDCINVLNLPEMERNRLIDAEWQAEEDEKGTATYATEISFMPITGSVCMWILPGSSQSGDRCDKYDARTNKQGKATITMSFDIHGTEELNTLMAKIRQNRRGLKTSRGPQADKKYGESATPNGRRTPSSLKGKENNERNLRKESDSGNGRDQLLPGL